MRVAVYARYSSERQNERSIADQVALCSRHAEGRGWTVVAVFSDAAISGSAMANRPGLLAALAAAERGEVDALLAEDEDRIARNLEHLAHVANRLEYVGACLATLQVDRVETMHVAFKGLMGQDFLRNLSAKTKRGVRSNAEKGLATGSRLFGYRSQPGGEVEIVPEEADVIRRIFTDFGVHGLPPRAIAAALNAEGSPSPRGGGWNASSINGSRQRANGVLWTELYAGVKVWGRMDVRKHPETGRRTPVMRPPEEWRRTPVPHLRIVDDALWTAVQARKADGAGVPLVKLRERRRGLFSGLIRCGVCGGPYSMHSADQMACSRRRERGPDACANPRTVSRCRLERMVLDGLQERLLSPAAVALYVRTYHETWMAQRRDVVALRRPIVRRLGEIERALDRGTNAILDGTAPAGLGVKLQTMEAEQAKLTLDLAELHDDAPPIELHPRLAERYAERVGLLQAELATAGASPETADRETIAAVRELIDRIDVVPSSLTEKGAPFELVLHGRLSAFIKPGNEAEAAAPPWGSKLVAGGGIEPPTCGL